MPLLRPLELRQADNTSGLLDLIRQERARRAVPGDVVIFRWQGMTDAEFEAEVEARRRSGRIGPSTRITVLLRPRRYCKAIPA